MWEQTLWHGRASVESINIIKKICQFEKKKKNRKKNPMSDNVKMST